MVGRPSAWKDEFVEQGQKLALLGAVDREIADFFGVTARTLDNWKLAHPEFMRALTLGKDVADDRVEKSLYHRAVGYSQDAVKIFMPAGANAPIYAPYTERFPPEVSAIVFWLKNRRKEVWKDKQEGDASLEGITIVVKGGLPD